MRPILASTNASRLSVDEALEAVGFGRFQLRLALVCGLVLAAEGLETMLLSVLGPILSCRWALTDAEVAGLSSAVFLAMLAGAPVWTALAHLCGHRGAALVAFLLLLYFGAASAAAPTFGWLLLARCLVGFGIGGSGVIASGLFSEFMPRAMRGPATMLEFVWWSIGTLFVAGLAFAVLPGLGWRWIVLLSATPLLLALVCFRWVAESPRFLLLSRRPVTALEVLNGVARLNRQMPISATLTTHTSAQGRARLLLHGEYARGTALQAGIWFGCGLAYYGAVLVAAELPRAAPRCPLGGCPATAALPDRSCCSPLTNAALTTVAVATAGELPALLLSSLLLSCVGRRAAMAGASACGAALFLGLAFCTAPAGRDALLLLTRMATYAAFCTAHLYTSEEHPPAVRAAALGLCLAAQKAGAAASPFVAQLLLPRYSPLAALGLYAAAMAAVALGCLLLPLETRGRALPPTVDQRYVREAAAEGSMEGMSILGYDTFGKQ